MLGDRATFAATDDPTTDAVPYDVARGVSGVPPAQAAADLALVDERFGRSVLEASVRELVRHWCAASDGDEHRLDELATPAALARLLAGDVAIRGPEITRLDVARVRAMRRPAELVVDFDLRAWRGPRDPGAQEGLLNPPQTRLVVWRLVLSGKRQDPWRLAEVLQPSTISAI